MSIQNAIDFIAIYKQEDRLRDFLGSLQKADEVRNYLRDLTLEFSDEELEEAYNLLSVKAIDEEDHNILTQVRQSYIMLISKH